MTPRGATEHRWEVDGLTIAGLAWGDPLQPPLLALHGWLDNAASFAHLAPLLHRHYVIALDLSGHGRSSWRSDDATYQIYDDLPQIHTLIHHWGWESCGLVGHSRGAIMATLYAASFPERVSRLVLLDGLAPQPAEEADFVPQLRQFMLERERYLHASQTVYPGLERAITVREAYGLPRAAAELIVPRNLRDCPGGCTWTTDPRLRGASAMKLTRGQVDAMLAAVSVPTLLLLAEQGLAAGEHPRITAEAADFPHCTVESHRGGHHFHLEEGVVTLAARIEQFLGKHD